MNYIDLAKSEMFSYKSNCKELYAMQQESKPVLPAINGYIKGRISRPVEAEVMRLLKDERYTHLVRSTQAVEYALAKVQQFPEGELTVKIFEVVYRDRTHTLFGAAMDLNLSYITAKRYNAYLVKMVAIKAGYLPTK